MVLLSNSITLLFSVKQVTLLNISLESISRMFFRKTLEEAKQSFNETPRPEVKKNESQPNRPVTAVTPTPTQPAPQNKPNSVPNRSPNVPPNNPVPRVDRATKPKK